MSNWKDGLRPKAHYRQDFDTVSIKPSTKVKRWLLKQAETYGVRPCQILERIVEAEVRNDPEANAGQLPLNAS